MPGVLPAPPGPPIATLFIRLHELRLRVPPPVQIAPPNPFPAPPASLSVEAPPCPPTAVFPSNEQNWSVRLPLALKTPAPRPLPPLPTLPRCHSPPIPPTARLLQ